MECGSVVVFGGRLLWCVLVCIKKKAKRGRSEEKKAHNWIWKPFGNQQDLLAGKLHNFISNTPAWCRCTAEGTVKPRIQPIVGSLTDASQLCVWAPFKHIVLLQKLPFIITPGGALMYQIEVSSKSAWLGCSKQVVFACAPSTVATTPLAFTYMVACAAQVVPVPLCPSI